MGTFNVHHIPVLHMNTNQALEWLEWGIYGLCVAVISFDLRCESVT